MILVKISCETITNKKALVFRFLALLSFWFQFGPLLNWLAHQSQEELALSSEFQNPSIWWIEARSLDFYGEFYSPTHTHIHFEIRVLPIVKKKKKKKILIS